jgi:RND family efflux transporter MFP subunit
VGAAETTLANAYSTMLNSGLDAIAAAGNASDGTITVTGTYDGTVQGEYRIFTESGGDYRILGRGVETSSNTDPDNIVRGVPLRIGTHGLYITFSTTGSFPAGDRWIISIPNTQASTYLTNLNAYESAKKSLEQAEAALALKQAEARPPDLQAAQAQVISAQGQVDAAQVAYNNTILRAPTAGTITQVDTRVGEQAIASQPVMILQDVDNLYVEASVSEADIASIKTGQPVDYTFDAFGPDRRFTGKVETVNPASTVISGVVNYKVTASVEAASEIKPGMTANMTVLVAEKDAVLAVPSNAILNKNGGKYVRVVDNPKQKTYQEVEVQTGLNADGGMVEIVSGLSEGQEVVIDI